MISTPVMVTAGIALVVLWWTGTLGNLLRPLGAFAARPQLPNLPAWPSAPPSLDTLDSNTLGMAYQRALKREAEDQVARTLHEQNRAAAVAAYVTPFSAGGSAPGQPPPPAPGPPPLTPNNPTHP